MNIFGITKVRVAEFRNTETLNKFLEEHDGNIISIMPTRCGNGYDWYSVVYREDGKEN